MFLPRLLSGDHTMKRTLNLSLVVLIMALSVTPAWANSAPVVSNVSAAQRGDDSKLVDIYYDLADADGDNCTVWVLVSADGGTAWDVPAFTFAGVGNSIGPGIAPGVGKHVIWDAGHDILGKSGTFKVRVFADDGHGDDLVLVLAGDFRYDDSTVVYVPSYMIGRTEVTNRQYCEYLNAADPSGSHYFDSMEIIREVVGSDVYYHVQSGRDNYPIRYTTYYDAEAYCQWRSSVTGLNYHLPNQYQWQKAAAWDPQGEIFYVYGHGSSSISCIRCNYGHCVGESTEVGSYDPYQSPYGCYDMSGNVWEWTSEQDGSSRVFRGGAWSYVASYCTTTSRASSTPSYRGHIVGFRLSLDLN